MYHYNAEEKEWSGIRMPSILNPKQNLGPLILNMLERRSSKIAQISADTGVTLTCGEIRLRTVRVAQNLTKMGFKKGDMVSLAVKNHENVAPILFGCFCIGTPMNGLDAKFNEEELHRMLGSIQPKLIICEQENLGLIQKVTGDIHIDPKFMVYGPPKDGVASVDDLFVPTGNEHTYL